MSLVVDALIHFCNVSTIGLCGFMKVPQIHAIIKAKSVKGLSLASLILELTSYVITLSYNVYAGYALITYFEYPLMVTQDVVMLAIFLSLTGRLSPLVILPAAAGAYFSYSIAMGLLSEAFITTLVGLCTPISASSKVVALLAIISSKNSETVSVSAWSISAYTCLTRIFTIYVESADPVLLLNFITSLVLNLLIITAAIYYKPRAKKD
ncbi:solute carrier family 66 member 3-like [Penaeus monodon]|uniref:solute carrier family 66 member 3-like n=1 Tax=Penaeus monodon TaxID=6687 RepID=UPI0018A7433C|nr:solute carrier family 66 member 3-like [Penaeus monodon]